MTTETDKELREKFSKVLGAPTGSVYGPSCYYGIGDRVIYSWEQIFYEVGRLAERAAWNITPTLKHQMEYEST